MYICALCKQQTHRDDAVTEDGTGTVLFTRDGAVVCIRCLAMVCERVRPRVLAGARRDVDR